MHFVDAGVDSGPIIGQQTVPVLDDDTPETLHQRIQAAEHELYPKCVAAIARGVEVRGRRVFRETACAAQALPALEKRLALRRRRMAHKAGHTSNAYAATAFTTARPGQSAAS